MSLTTKVAKRSGAAKSFKNAKALQNKRHNKVSSGRIIGKDSKPTVKVISAPSKNKKPETPDPAYSLYSTDSEDPLQAANKDLDRCAKLLSDILDEPQSRKQPKHFKTGKKMSDHSPQFPGDTGDGVRASSVLHFDTSKKPMEPFQPNIDTVKQQTAFNKHLISSTPQSDKLSPTRETKNSHGSVLKTVQHNMQQNIPSRTVSSNKWPWENANGVSIPKSASSFKDSEEIPVKGSPAKDRDTRVRFSENLEEKHYMGLTPSPQFDANENANMYFDDVAWRNNATPPTQMQIEDKRGKYMEQNYSDSSIRTIDNVQSPYVSTPYKISSMSGSTDTVHNQKNVSPAFSQQTIGDGSHFQTPVQKQTLTAPYSANETSKIIPSPASHDNELLATRIHPYEPCVGSVFHPFVQTNKSYDLAHTALRQTMKDLRAVLSVSGHDVEVERLLLDLEKYVIELSDTQQRNLQSEVDLSIQPLRSENSQLRRRLRIVNQQLRQREEDATKAKEGVDKTFEMIHLQAANAALKKQVQDEQLKCRKMEDSFATFEQAIESFKTEKQKLINILAEKDSGHLKSFQDWATDNRKLKQQMEIERASLKTLESKLDSLQSENHILQINLNQKTQDVLQLKERLQETDAIIKNLQFEIQRQLSKTVALGATADYGSPFKQHGDYLSTQNSSPAKRSLLFENAGQHGLKLTAEALSKHNGNLWNSKSDPTLENRRSSLNGHVSWTGIPLEEGQKCTHSYGDRQNGEKFPIENIPKDFMHKAAKFALGEPEDFSLRQSWPQGKHYSSPLREFVDSTDMSRYSVTDYFKKYTAESGQFTRPATITEEPELRTHYPDRHRTHSEQKCSSFGIKPESNIVTNPHGFEEKVTQLTSLEKPQAAVFRHSELDASLSTINDDAMSESTKSCTSVATAVMDIAFQTGLQELDDNIQRLQKKLQDSMSK